MGKDKGHDDRKRAPNFTDRDIRLLTRLVIEYRHIIENKKTDAVTWKMKEEAWIKIAEKFTANSGTVYRTAGNLRQKYEQLKKSLKKKVTKNKEETFKTGGGPPEYIKIEGYEKDLLQVLNTQVGGLACSIDSDSILPLTDITGMELIIEKSHMLDANDITERGSASNINVDASIEVYSDFMVPTEAVQQKSSSSLSNEENYFEPNNNSNSSNQVGFVENNIQNPTQEHNDVAHSLALTEEAQEDKYSLPNQSKNRGDTKKWNTWTPNSLKSKKNPVLSTPRKEPIKNVLNRKVDSLLDGRDELIKLQTECMKKEDQRREKEHVAQIQKLNLEKRLLLRKELRCKAEHKKRMELIELEIALKKHALQKF